MTAVELHNTAAARGDDLPPLNLREIAAQLRYRALALVPADIGIDAHAVSSSTPSSIWGVVIETAHPDAVASLVVLADGSVSLYVSDGNGCIGCGTNHEVRLAGADLLAVAERGFVLATATDDVGYPPPGYVRFYFHSFEGLRSVQVRLEDVNGIDAQLAALYFAGQRVIRDSERVGAGQSLAQEVRRTARDPAPTANATSSHPDSIASNSRGSSSCSSVGNAAPRLRT